MSIFFGNENIVFVWTIIIKMLFSICVNLHLSFFIKFMHFHLLWNNCVFELNTSENQVIVSLNVRLLVFFFFFFLFLFFQEYVIYEIRVCDSALFPKHKFDFFVVVSIYTVRFVKVFVSTEIQRKGDLLF